MKKRGEKRAKKARESEGLKTERKLLRKRDA